MNPSEYFATIVPRQYADAMESASPEVLAQPELSVSIVIEGEDGGTYGMRAQGKEFIFVPGGIPAADMQVQIAIADWRLAASHGGMEAVVDYVQRRKVQVVKSLKGTVTLELERDGGAIFQTTTVFGQQAEPVVTIMMTADDYTAMLNGDLNGQMAFMMGKLKFDGSLALLMAIGALAGK
jgi:putative sterol carrier protein